MTNPRCNLETIHREIGALSEAVMTMSRMQATAANDISARLTRLEALPHLSPDDAVQIKLLVEYVPVIVADASYRRAMQRVLAPWRKFIIGTAAVFVAIGLLWDRLVDLVTWIFR